MKKSLGLKKVTTDLFWTQAVFELSDKGSLHKIGIELAERKSGGEMK